MAVVLSLYSCILCSTALLKKCLSCGQWGETGNIDKGFGLFYGDDSKSQNERIIGCADGCFYCESTGDAMIDILATLEEYLDI